MPLLLLPAPSYILRGNALGSSIMSTAIESVPALHRQTTKEKEHYNGSEKIASEVEEGGLTDEPLESYDDHDV